VLEERMRREEAANKLATATAAPAVKLSPEEEKKRAIEEQRLLTEELRRQGMENRKRTVEEQKRLEAEVQQAVAEKPVDSSATPTRRVIRPVENVAPATATASVVDASTPVMVAATTPVVTPTSGGPSSVAAEPARAVEPRPTSGGGVVEEARVKVMAVTNSFDYAPLPNNGCSSGRSYVVAELASTFDGLSSGVPVVLRIEDPTLGPARSGAMLAFTGLRRAGKGQDGTPVYCGKGSAFPLKK